MFMFGLSAFPQIRILNLARGLERRRRPASSRRRVFRPVTEVLDDRVTPVVSTWTGGGSNDNWTTAANWDTVPKPGYDLVFPISTSANDNFPANTAFNSITVTGDSVYLTGNGVTFSHGITSSSSECSLDLNVTLSNGSMSVSSGDLDIGGVLSAPGGLTKSGAGDLTFVGGSTFGDSATINGGRVRLSLALITSNMTLNNGSALFGIGGVGSITSNGSVVEVGFNNGGFGDFGTITTSSTALSSSSLLTINLGGTTPGGGSSGYDQLIDTSGSLTLNNVNLGVGLLSGFTPTPGNQFTIVNNAGTTPAVNGTFNNLPEGAQFLVAGFPFRISYRGTSGAGDNDVVLTALNTTATTLTSSVNPSTVGQTVTFTAAVTSSGGTPTGTVNFLDGTTQIGSGTLNGSGVATFSTSAAGDRHPLDHGSLLG